MKDLTKGNITKLMIEYAVPILIGSIFQQLYGIPVSGAVGPVTWYQIAREYDALVDMAG